MKNREVFLRDPASTRLANDGVAKVSEGTTPNEVTALRYELEHFVCEGQYREGMVRILESYIGNSDAAVQPAAWVSGFYGSGKSHLLKMFRHLWVDTSLPEWNGASARGLAQLPNEVNDLLKELDTLVRRCGGRYAACGTLPSGGGESVRLAVLGVLLRSIGLPEALPQARFCLWLKSMGIHDAVSEHIETSGKTLESELDHLYVSPVLAEAVLGADPTFASSTKEARHTIRTQFPVVDDVSTEEFIRTIRQVIANDGRIPCTLIVLDEIQLFIADSAHRSTDVQEVAEALCKQLDSRVLLIGAGQTALAGGVPLLQRLRGRFTIPVELSDTDVETVTRRVVLQKKANKRKAIEDMLALHAGEIDRQLAGTKIAVRADDRKTIVDDYPLLPVRRRFWEQVLRAVDLPGTASRLRTQLRIVYDAARETANEPLGTVMPADFIFDQVQPNLRQTAILLPEIDDNIRRLGDGTEKGRLKKRLCGLIFLIQRLPRDPVVDIGVRATTETLADLMVRDLMNDGANLRARIPPLLESLVEQGMLIRIGGEYRLQTRESSEWDREFRNRQTKLNSDGPRIAGIRAECIKSACAEALKNVKLLQGKSKVGRRLVLHFGADSPECKGHEIPVWVRDEWGEKESTVVGDARAAGNDSPVVFVFVPRRNAADLRKAIVEREAAEGAIEFKGVPSTDGAREAKNAMATRSRAALDTRDMIIASIVDEARVFQGGGNESYGLSFFEKVKTVAEYSLDRLFPKFSDADDHRWNTVINRAKAGAEDALSAVDWADAPEKHPVCAGVLHAIGSGCKGKDIRDAFEAPPCGWPRDAIDAALIVLFTSGYVRAVHKGIVLQKGRLDQAKISVTDFRVETTTLSTRDRIKLRQLFQSVGIPCVSNEEAAAAGAYLSRLAELASSAGGDPPLPASPSTAHIEALRALAGNDRLRAILDKANELSADAQQWQELTHRAANRMKEWDDVVFLGERAAHVPEAHETLSQIEAITNERRLLERSDPLPGIKKPLTSTLREALTAVHKAFRAAYDKGIGELQASDAWQKIDKEQRNQILEVQGIEPPEKPALCSDRELIAALRQSSLETWKMRTDALPQRFANAATAAARLVEPEVQTVKVRPSTLKTEEEVHAWVRETEADLLKKLKSGPLLIS